MHGNGILNHREALNDMLNNKIKRGYEKLETIVHTDQGAVYSSVSFNNMFNSHKVTRSMSRAGTPTDNPVIESKNDWMKKEMHIDFDKIIIPQFKNLLMILFGIIIIIVQALHKNIKTQLSIELN